VNFSKSRANNSFSGVPPARRLLGQSGRMLAFSSFCFYNLLFPSHTNRNFNMANSAQARKRARQAVKQRAHNMSLRSTLRTAIKKVQKAVNAGDKTAAQAVFKDSESIIDSIADKKVIHKNKAARHKSRLSAAIKAL
jgi:small subunit ribosomal protein S20